MSSRSPGPSSIAVVAILTDGGAAVEHTLEAVAAQNYEPAAVYMIGADSKEVAAALGVTWQPSLGAFLDELEPTSTHVWLLHAGTVPRPDALYALVFESERVAADVAGSKLLELPNADRLISVGIATDVFDVPYVGLDEDELDAGQYDVVRDVAAVGGASMLVRRDLLKGLGGPDRTMAPGAAAIDLCQRARVLGARVVVVPSSEVGVGDARTAPAWSEEAGRIRAMIKVYSALTLLWALPLRLLIGLVEAVLAPFAGRWTLFAWIRSWIWNLLRLPSTLRARRNARASAAAGDAELFRYQLRGSAALRSLWIDLLDAARSRFPAEDRAGVASLAQEVRRPAFGVGLAALLFSFVATRQIWSGFPAGGLSLPLPERGADAVAAYAGGWNPAGFGSTEQLPPFLGIAGVWQQLWFDNPGLASGTLILGAFVGGIWGMTRLLRTWSIESVPGIFAGIALMAGPAARTIAGGGDVANLVALGLVPWAARIAVAPWPQHWMGRIGRLLAAGWVTALLANLSPDLMLLPAAALGVHALLDPQRLASWVPVAVSTVGVAIAFGLLRPWISNVDAGDYLRAGDAFWSPGLYLGIAILLAATAAIVAAPAGMWRYGLWGALLGAGGFGLARTASEGGGRHLEAFGLAAVALGSAIVIGVVFESLRRLDSLDALGRTAVALGALGAAVVAISAVLVVAPGRAGLPSDQLAEALRFTDASIDDDSAARVLLIGPDESFPGTARTVRGATYRVASAPTPYMWEVELPAPGPADAALEQVLLSVIEGGSFRAGEELAQFGIRWVVEMDSTPLSSTLIGQLDLIPLDGLRRTVFLVDAPDAVRAVSDSGEAWLRAGTGYSGAAASTVLVKEHAHPGWGSDADPNDWALTLDGSNGEVQFQAGSERSAGRFSLIAGVVLALLSGLLRRRR